MEKITSEQITREKMQSMGMTEAQIAAILNTIERQSEDGLAYPGDVEERQQDGKPVLVEIQREEEPIYNVEDLKVTTIDDLQSYAGGALIKLPDFAEGQPFVARLTRPSMLMLAKDGKIPNELLASANELFTNGSKGLNKDDEKMLSEVCEIMEAICRAAMKEPTYDDIIEAGLHLSDQQMTAIFNYTQTGVDSLKPFRKK